jgi:hypothetical protein
MKLLMKKAFDLSDLRYPWLLLASMLLFVFSLYNNKMNPDISTAVEWLTYGTSIICAFVWSVLNYIDHIKINALYRKHNSTEAYVDSLTMKKQEKEDLKTYLDDFVKDLEANGKTKDEAVKIAISQFQVQEFTSLSKNSGILELPAHHYLIGYVLIFAAVAVILFLCLTNAAFKDVFLLHAIYFMLILYSVSFVGLLLFYKLLDLIVAKKLLR